MTDVQPFGDYFKDILDHMLEGCCRTPKVV